MNMHAWRKPLAFPPSHLFGHLGMLLAIVAWSALPALAHPDTPDGPERPNVAAPTAHAVASMPPPAIVFDDMEHGDPLGNGWFSFGGSVGGGGIGPDGDVPPMDGGSFSLGSGWGSGGVPGFLGGFGRTFPLDLTTANAFSFWINPDAGQDYLLEINLQEDDDGDGVFPFPAPNDDEFQFNCVISPAGPCAIAGGGWQQVTIPFTDFFDDNSLHGGNGIFDPTPVGAGGNGELIGIVIAIVTNSGADATFRTDLWGFNAPPPPPAIVLFDDMEHGDPLGNGWFSFGGSVGGGGIGPDGDVPPMDGGAFSLGSGWGSGGVPGFLGGFGRTFPLDLTTAEAFSFWINPDAGQDYLLEINLQEDDDGDGVFPFPAPNDDEFQYNCVISPAGPCAIAGGGWQKVTIPITDFFDDNSIHGGNGIFDPTPVGAGGNGELIGIVIAIVTNSGADATFRTDFWNFEVSGAPPPPPPPPPPVIVFDDMEHGDPGANGWFSFGGSVGGGGIGPDGDVPPMDGGAFSLGSGWGSGGVPGFLGGFGRTNPLDLTTSESFSFWINPDAGQDYLLEINLQEDDDGDGVFPFPAPNDDEFQYNCVISPAGPCAIAGGGWQKVTIPITDFFDDNSIHGGNGIFDPTPVGAGGNGELIGIVIAIVTNSGADATFRTDYWAFESAPPPPMAVDVMVNVMGEWNLLGLPVDTANKNAGVLFPSSLPNTFYTFDGTYEQPSPAEFEAGMGAWLRFPAAETVTLTGLAYEDVSLDLGAGWNLIAGPNCSVSNFGDVGGILIPGTLLSFDGAYQPAGSTEAGMGYWQRTSAAGTVTLDCAAPKGGSVDPFAMLASFDVLSVEDARGVRQRLFTGSMLPEGTSPLAYTMPPKPFAGALDVRFADGRYVAEGYDATVIQLAAGAYPLTLGLEPDAEGGSAAYTVEYLDGSDVVERHVLTTSGALTLDDPAIDGLRLSAASSVGVEGDDVPRVYALDQNYPNPFNPSTTIQFALPEASAVTLHVFDVLGRTVRVLQQNEARSAGQHTVTFDGQGLPSGVYFYRIEAGSFTATRRMLLVK